MHTWLNIDNGLITMMHLLIKSAKLLSHVCYATCYFMKIEFLVTVTMIPKKHYSECLKSEHVRISDRGSLFGSNSCSVQKVSEIRTKMFGFQTQICVWNPNTICSNVRISDNSTKLDRFINKNILFMTIFIVKRSWLV